MRKPIALLLLLLPLPVLADGAPSLAGTFAVAGKESMVTYHLVHKLHRFDGVSKSVDGKARVSDAGQAQVMVRIPVESFDSGNVNRDEHMKETVEAARFPSVELKAVGTIAPSPATQKVAFKAQLTFHGVTQIFELPVDVTVESPTRIKASAHVVLSLEAYKVERPALMFVKVDDGMALYAQLVFVKGAAPGQPQ